MVVASGERLMAQDMLDLTFFPVGSILMMDGNWTDGRGGWYICDGRDTPLGKTPNLKDTFIRGGVSAGNTGGSNSAVANVSLTAKDLPAHSHPLSGTTLTTSNESQGHTHTVTASGSISGRGTHNHSITDPGHAHSVPNAASGVSGGSHTLRRLDDTSSATTNIPSAKTGVTVTAGEGSHEHTFTGSQVTSSGTNVNHTHTLTLSGNTGANSSSSSMSIPVSVETVPAYYTVIYIKKMA
jgi:microcystin-dependent protein